MSGKERVDPRKSARPLADVASLLAQGQAHFAGERYWDAHEAWEEAWHALRAAGRSAEGDFLQGLILVSAALENLRRGKPDGFRRQMAQGLHQLRTNLAAAPDLGVAEAQVFVDDIVGLYLAVARRLRPAWEHVGKVPRLRLTGNP